MGSNLMTNLLVSILVLIVFVASSPIIQQANDVTCDCEYCDEKPTTTIIDPVEEKEMTTIVTNEKKGSNNSDETICARDRDFLDKTFPSVCHMLCHNQCTRYRGALLEKENATRRVPLAYRTNYYILWDGPCERSKQDTN